MYESENARLRNVIQKVEIEKSELYKRITNLEEYAKLKSNEININQNRILELESQMKLLEAELSTKEKIVADQNIKIEHFQNEIGELKIKLDSQILIEKNVKNDLKNVIKDFQKMRFEKDQEIQKNREENQQLIEKLNQNNEIKKQNANEICKLNTTLKSKYEESNDIKNNSEHANIPLQGKKNENNNVIEIPSKIQLGQIENSKKEIIKSIQVPISEYNSKNSLNLINELKCPICQKSQNYMEMKKCIIDSQKLGEKVSNGIKNEEFWNFCCKNINLDNIIILNNLLKISTNLKFIHIGKLKRLQSKIQFDMYK